MQHSSEDLVNKNLQKVIKLTNAVISKEHQKVNLEDWQNLISNLFEMVQFLPLHTVVVLHFRQILEPLLKAVNQLTKSSKFLEVSNYATKDIKSIFQCIYDNSFDCFLQHERKEYGILISELISRKFITNNEEKKLLNSNSRTLVIKNLLERVYQLAGKRSSTENSFISRKQLNSFIERQLLVQDPQNLLEQIVMNWIKTKVYLLQNEHREYICCRIHFQHMTTSNISGFTEAADQEFKDYRWPLENESIKFHLTKTIVGYLNTTGGIIYVGLKEDKSKMVEVKGIELSPQQKIEFLKFIHDDILNGVYPKQPDRRQYEQKKNGQSDYRKKLMDEFNKEKRFGYDYRINKYISIDFLDVYNGKSYINVLGDKGMSLYVVRIKIKVGDPKQLYHLINKYGIPETYLREDKSVRKKNIVEFYNLFTDRMTSVNRNKQTDQKNDKHPHCRFQALEDVEKEGKSQLKNFDKV